MPFDASLPIYLSNKLPTKSCSRVELCEQCIHRYVMFTGNDIGGGLHIRGLAKSLDQRQ